MTNPLHEPGRGRSLGDPGHTRPAPPLRTRAHPVARRLRNASVTSALCAYVFAILVTAGLAEAADNSSSVIRFGNVVVVWLLLMALGVLLLVTGIVKLLGALPSLVVWCRGPRPSPWPGVAFGVAALGWALTISFGLHVLE